MYPGSTSPSAEPGRSGAAPGIGTRVGVMPFEIGSWPGTTPGWAAWVAAGCAAAVGPTVTWAAGAVVLAAAGFAAAVGAGAGGWLVGDGAAAGPHASSSANPP